jgi:3-oxoacid CoA-transferase B subunit
LKKGLTRELIALRVSHEFRDGMFVNLGVGIPTMIQNFLPSGIDIIIHTETGVLGCGRIAEPEEWDSDLINAGGQPITVIPGASFFDQIYAFGMMRGGHIDLTILGAYQVSEQGDLASWAPPGRPVAGIGGAMDVICGAKKVYVAMEHVDPKGHPKILKKCTIPLTAERVVKKIFTDLAVIDVTQQGLLLREIAPGFTPEEVQKVTEAKLIISKELKEIEL